MRRGLMGAALWMSASAFFLDGTAEHALAQGAAIAKAKGWQMETSVSPASFKGAGNKPILLVFR